MSYSVFRPYKAGTNQTEFKTEIFQYLVRVQFPGPAGTKDKAVKFQGSTGLKDKRAAERFAKDFERDREAEAKQLRQGADGAAVGMTFGAAAIRFGIEVVAKWGNARNRDAWTNYLAILGASLGIETPLAKITHNRVQLLINARCQDTVNRGGGVSTPVSPITVNLSVVKPLRSLFTLARDSWGVPGLQPINWRTLVQKEPTTRVRWVRADEEEMLRKALPPQYDRLLRFARITGLRKAEQLIRWDQIDTGIETGLGHGAITLRGKGDKFHIVAICDEVQGILDACRVDNDTPYVFTTQWHKNGKRIPITYQAVTTTWRNAKLKGLIPADMHWHDLRHDFATKMMEATGDIMLVSKLLNHAHLQTSQRYAHVMPANLIAARAAHSKKLGQARRKASIHAVA
jgi:integrase